MKRIAALVLAGLLAGCGGGGGGVDLIPAAHAQTTEPVIGQLHCILRPDANGQWYIQDDAGHKPIGIYPIVTQTTTGLRIAFNHSWHYAGTIQITSDDDFRNIISGYANLGTTASEIIVLANGQQIDPAKVWDYLPAPGNGNFWINVTMVD